MVSGVAISPSDADEYFVTYTDGKVYHSMDAGESWELLLETRDRLYGITIVNA